MLSTGRKQISNSNACTGRIEAAAQGAGNTKDSLTTATLPEGIAMGENHSTHERAIILNAEQKLAYEYLQLSAQNLNEATSRRIYWVQLARHYGLTWTRIGEALGISDVAARRLHQRNAEVPVG